MEAKYYIDGDGGNNMYNTLDEVRRHVSFEPEAYNGLYVCRVNDESFCRVIKLKTGGKVILAKK